MSSTPAICNQMVACKTTSVSHLLWAVYFNGLDDRDCGANAAALPRVLSQIKRARAEIDNGMLSA
jgi:hypothetical protein